MTRRGAKAVPHALAGSTDAGAHRAACALPQILHGYEPLDAYMLLPVEQYFVLDPKQIAHLGGNRFVLFVPRINVRALARVQPTPHLRHPCGTELHMRRACV
jgi:hypothetical protein